MLSVLDGITPDRPGMQSEDPPALVSLQKGQMATVAKRAFVQL